MTTGELVASIREQRGVLQKDLARFIQVDPVVLNRIEKGKRPVRGDELKAIADYFNVSTDYLLGRENATAKTSLSKEQATVLSGFDELNEVGRKDFLGYLDYLLNYKHAGTSSEFGV